MKKYKLIKEYPGSVELGAIRNDCGGPILQKYFTNYSEFWEEVKDHAYQIISFSSNKWSDRLAILDENGRYATLAGSLGWSLKELLEVGVSVKSGHIKIHSVKRLSDGEIFTIGDKAKTTGKDHSHTITSFRIKQYCIGKDSNNNYLYDGIDRIWIDWEDKCGGNWLEFTEKAIEKDYEILKTCPIEGTIYSVKRLSDGEVFTVGDLIKTKNCYSSERINEIKLTDDSSAFLNGIWFYCEKGCSHFKRAIKAKQPIFLTHDGKDIFVGDRIIWVNKDSLLHGVFTADYGSLFCSNQHAYFTSAIDAEDYIKRNKVLFTTEDGVDIYSYDTRVHWVIQDKYEYELNTGRSNVELLQQQPTTYKVFSTKQAAEYYVLVNAKVLSIEDFWNFALQSGRNAKKQRTLKELVKERLNIE